MKAPNTAVELDTSWLVQRLRKPVGKTLLGSDNPFSFGGGLKNGGLKDEAMTLLRGVFSFDYMGAAEFEWGAVPKALSQIAKNVERYTATAIDVDGQGVSSPRGRTLTRSPAVSVGGRLVTAQG